MAYMNGSIIEIPEENSVLLPKADSDTDLKPVRSLGERATHEHDERGLRKSYTRSKID